MKSETSSVPYSFSMVNLINLMPEWSWQRFDEIMNQAQTKNVELVPGMVLGAEWDQYITKTSAASEALAQLMDCYTVTSIQSLTYGLNINLADALNSNNDVVRRFHSLAYLGNMLKCRVFVLGSPGQKKMTEIYKDPAALMNQFVVNCNWIANLLGNELILSLEHNTNAQGAEYCNTLADIMCAVKTIKFNGTDNVGINLDTKCLIHEFGENVDVGEMLANSELADLITSIQVSYDFLTREVPHRVEDQRQLLAFARERSLPLSLEEFGLMENQVNQFVKTWNFQM
jgi:hypothetical protein